jgi:hypothetical protein
MAKCGRREHVMRRGVRRARARLEAARGRSAALLGEQVQRVQVTLGDLIAAAFDSVGSEVRRVAAVLSSAEMTRATGRPILITQGQALCTARVAGRAGRRNE